jgi:uncharacterized phage-associated protein
MEDFPPYDPRIIANALIDLAADFEIPITHLSMQKIVYFLHETYLKEKGEPLCSGFFEAWKHGPVHPQLWSSFKDSGRDKITQHVEGLDVISGRPRKLPPIKNRQVRLHIVSEGCRLLQLSSSRLVDISHARGSPWDVLTRGNSGQREYGARISNDIIVSSRGGRMIPIRDAGPIEDDMYEQPPT